MSKKLTFVLELTKKCNNNCQYCYNVWKANKSYPNYELSTQEWKKIIDKIAEETKPKIIALSGGEPLLRNEFFEILKHINKKGIKTTLITNGTLLTKEVIIKCLDYGVINFELPLLSDKPEIHDALTRNKGSWDKVIQNIIEIKKQGGSLAVVFVIVKLNVNRVKETMKISIALDADSILANRFNVGGEGIKYKEAISPSPQELDKAYSEINALAEEYEIRVNSGIPVPRCILDTSKYQHINFYDCPHGQDYAYYAVDPAGNVRPCNHSSLILGNLLNQTISDITNSKACIDYFHGCPKECKGCQLENECQGGCRAAAEVYYGEFRKLDPFVADNFKGVI